VTVIESRVHMLLFEAMLHSNDPGSLMFMERFIWKQKYNNDNAWGVPFNEVTCKMLLSKYAKTASIGTISSSLGGRAERWLHRAYQKLYSTGWHPDVECAKYVVHAYLPLTNRINNSALLLSRVRKADHFVRHFVRQFRLQQVVSTIIVSHRHPQETSYHIIERLLDAYNDVVVLSSSLRADDAETSRVDTKLIAQQADELFRFFMIQYRDGRIHAEDPSERHLQQLVRLWYNCCRYNETTTEMIQFLPKIHEYRHIIRKMNQPTGVQSTNEILTR
jgi:hypothetical protein